MYSATAKSHGDKFRAGTIDSLRYQASLIASGRYEHPVVGRATFASSGRRRVPSSRRSKKAVPSYAVNHLGAYAVYDESDSSEDEDEKDPNAAAAPEQPKPGDQLGEEERKKAEEEKKKEQERKDAQVPVIVQAFKDKFIKLQALITHVRSATDGEAKQEDLTDNVWIKATVPGNPDRQLAQEGVLKQVATDILKANGDVNKLDADGQIIIDTATAIDEARKRSGK